MNLEDAIEHYKGFFNEKIDKYGAVPQGVDYNGTEAQCLRFEQLAKIIDSTRAFALLDFGCGYGGLLDFLQGKGWSFQYLGYDMLEKMIAAARASHADAANTRFVSDEAELHPCEYAIAGAIFNNKFEAPGEEWKAYTLDVLQRLDSLCTRGFSFNMLSSYSDADRMSLRPDLYFADPLFYFDHCKRNFSRDVALLHDYGLYDFTVLVRKGA